LLKTEEVAVLSSGKAKGFIICRALRKQIVVHRILEIVSTHGSKVER
jgi:hypothetical protein